MVNGRVSNGQRGILPSLRDSHPILENRPESISFLLLVHTHLRVHTTCGFTGGCCGHHLLSLFGGLTAGPRYSLAEFGGIGWVRLNRVEFILPVVHDFYFQFIISVWPIAIFSRGGRALASLS